MKLNGDILFDALAEAFVVKKYGHYSQQLMLPRPRLYSGWGREFEENCLYIAQGEQLPGNPIFREGAVVICIGSSMPEDSDNASNKISPLRFIVRAPFFRMMVFYSSKGPHFNHPDSLFYFLVVFAKYDRCILTLYTRHFGGSAACA